MVRGQLAPLLGWRKTSPELFRKGFRWPVLVMGLAALGHLVFGRRLGHRAHWVAVPAVGLAFGVALLAFQRVWLAHETFAGPLFDWIVAGSFRAPVTLQLDHLSAVMLLVVTGLFSFRDLSVDLLPKADPAVVQVLINLPGASPDELNSAVR